MTFKNTLLLAASAVALLGSVQFTVAQTSVVTTDAFTTDDTTRLKAETARLYASTIARITQAIEDDISADATDSIIAGLRTGDLSALTSLSAATLDLAKKLKIQALVLDVTDGTVSEDLRIAVFVRDGALSQGVTRANIESAARDLGYSSLVRFQNGEVVGARGAVSIPTSAGSAAIEGVGTWVGVSSKAKITSRGTGTEEVRVLACPDGFYGTGIIQQRHNDRTTTLGGVVVDDFDDWIEVSSSCSAERSQQVRFFDVCAGPDGELGTDDDGQSLYEVTQHVRQSRTNPFETEIFRDPETVTLTDAAECVSSDRIAGDADFLMEKAAILTEFGLKTIILPSDVGNGPGTVPVKISTDGTSTPVSTIPFPVTSDRDYEFTRSCFAEYGDVALPAGFSYRYQYADSDILDTVTPFYGGYVTFNRDYNRREKYFSDHRRKYILNYDVVLDPNPYGHASKGRRTIADPMSRTHAFYLGRSPKTPPSTDGWYHQRETCDRTLFKVENKARVRQCRDVAPYATDFPNGDINDRSRGKGTYLQTTPRDPRPNGPTLQDIDWEEWTDLVIGCYKTTVEREDETRCSQTRTLVTTTHTYHDGRVTSSTSGEWVTRSTVGPSKSGGGFSPETGLPETGPGDQSCPQACCSGGCHDEDLRPRCSRPTTGGGAGGNQGESWSGVDIDRDGIPDFSDRADAEAAGHFNGRDVTTGSNAGQGAFQGGSTTDNNADDDLP